MRKTAARTPSPSSPALVGQPATASAQINRRLSFPCFLTRIEPENLMPLQSRCSVGVCCRGALSRRCGWGPADQYSVAVDKVSRDGCRADTLIGPTWSEGGAEGRPLVRFRHL